MYTLRCGVQHWDLRTGARCPSEECDAIPSFRDPQACRIWMQQFLVDERSMLALREIVAQSPHGWALFRMSDEQVLGRAAVLFSAGEWHLHAARGLTPADRSTVREAAAEAPAYVVTRVLRKPPPPPLTEPTLPVDADAAAIAEVLRRAAEQGIPFCEECMKKTPADGPVPAYA